MLLDDFQEYVPKVSVIVPVYNPGLGIRRCIESLRNQELEEIEMIFINDCGDDDSMEAVEAAAMEDVRIRIIKNSRNLGPGPSRNAGIEAAKGEYLSFVDPDDYVDLKFLSLLYKKAKQKKSDIVKGTCIFCKEEPDGTFTKKIRNELNKTIQERVMEGIPLFRTFTYQHWTAIYRRDLVLKHARYGTTRLGQDVTFLLMICMFCRDICIEENAIYYYVRRENSAVNQVTNNKLVEYLKAFKERCDYLESCKNVDRLELAGYVQGQAQYFMNYYLYWSYHSEYKSICMKCVEEIRSIIIGLSFAWEVIYLSEKVRILIMYNENPVLDILTIEGEVLDPKQWINNYSNGVRLIQKHPSIYFRTMKRDMENVYKAAFQVIVEQMIQNGAMSEGQYYVNLLKKEKEKLKQIIRQRETVPVSVIVPFYNPEKEKFRQCVESLINQSFENIELIFIDDCGTDESVDYINRLTEIDDRTIVIRNPLNLGPGISKNIGIENAKGKYLLFVKADDYLDSDYVYQLFEKAELTDADIVIGSVIEDEDDINNEKTQADLQYAFSGSIYKKDYLDNKRISFDKTYYAEDRLFLLRAMLNHPTISIVSDTYYYLHKYPEVYTDSTLKQFLLSFKNRMSHIEKRHDEYENKEIQLYLWKMIIEYLEIQVIIANTDLSSNIKDKYLEDVQMQVRRITNWKEYGLSNYVTDSFINKCRNLIASNFKGKTESVRMHAFLQVCENYKEVIEYCPEIVNADFVAGFKYAYRNSCQYLSKMIQNKDSENIICYFYKTIYACYKKSADGLKRIGIIL